MPDYTILLIDYDPRSVERLSRTLEQAGYAVVVAKDGIEGVELFAQLKPDLTLIEAMLPKKHGFEVCLELKQTEHGRQSPVLIITSVYRGRKYRNQAKHYYRCDDYLEKPISDEQLLATVGQFFEGREPSRARVEETGEGKRVTELSDSEIQEHLDNLLDVRSDSSSAGDWAGESEESGPAPGKKLDSEPTAIGSSDAGSVVPLVTDRSPQSAVHEPATGVSRRGGAQPAMVSDLPGVPEAMAETRPARPTPDEERKEPGKPRRSRLLLWIAFVSLLALGGMLAAIILI